MGASVGATVGGSVSTKSSIRLPKSIDAYEGASVALADLGEGGLVGGSVLPVSASMHTMLRRKSAEKNLILFPCWVLK